MKTIEVNPDPEIQVHQIGEEGHCVIADDFLKNPEDVVEYACANATKFKLQQIGYPGLLRDVDRAAMIEVQRFIRSHMTRQFSFLKGDIRKIVNVAFSVLFVAPWRPFGALFRPDREFRSLNKYVFV